MAEDESFVPLTHEILCQCLSEIKVIVNGGGFAFTKLDCSNRELTNMGNKVQGYEHLRHVVLSSNRLTDVAAVTQLPHVLTLHANSNEVASLSCLAEEGVNLPWCQRIDFSSNKLKALPPLAALGRLRFAYFASNEIASLEGFGDHPALEELDLQENQLTTLQGLGQLENLKRLVLTSNQLTSLEGLDCPVLTHAEFGKNQLVSLEHITGIPACVELDLSENQLGTEDPQMPEFRRLRDALLKMRKIKLAGNPSELRAVAVLCLPLVRFIDGEPVTDEDREAAKEKKQELLEAIAAAKAAAEEAAAAGEEEG